MRCSLSLCGDVMATYVKRLAERLPWGVTPVLLLNYLSVSHSNQPRLNAYLLGVVDVLYISLTTKSNGVLVSEGAALAWILRLSSLLSLFFFF